MTADLHIHSTLSPCASLEMSPREIVRRARDLSLDLIAVTDHNSVENSFYAREAGLEIGLPVLLGMEAQSAEEVHLVCLFEEVGEAEKFYAEVNPFIPQVKNDPEIFGDQVVVDLQGEIVRSEEILLINSLQLSLPELVELVKRNNGFVIPAHVESPRFGLLPNLGFVPAELAGSPLEISYNTSEDKVLKDFPALAGMRLVSASDAHYLRDIGRALVVLENKVAGLAELFAAIAEGRYTVRRRREAC